LATVTERLEAHPHSRQEVEMKKSVIICFLGMDGSGKSTLAKHLYEDLKKAQYNATYTWWLKREQSRFRRALKAFGTSKYLKLEIDAKNKRVAASNNTIIGRVFQSWYPIIPILDYLSFALSNAWIPKVSSNDAIIIFDRFMYDVVLALSDEFEFTERQEQKLLKLCSILVPKPDLIFKIDVPPEIAYARKKDEIDSIRDAEVKHEAYNKLDLLLPTLTSGKIIRIDNTRDFAVVRSEILKTTLTLIEGDRN
jgi:thymidylate kinase